MYGIPSAMKAFEFLPSELVKRRMVENNLKNFQFIWPLDAGWFEERNVRRGGWSGVSRYEIANDNTVFIKRQENHCYRAWDNFFMLVPTFYREFKNIQRFVRLGIPTLELLYFGQRKEAGKLRAILVTQELEGFLPLDSDQIKDMLRADFKLRKLAVKKIAEVVSHMHQQHLQHNCLYEKHIFVKQLQDGSIEVRLIDLEKVKWKPSKRQAMFRDLGSLYRHSKGWSDKDYLRFFLYYQKEHRLNKQLKKVLYTFLKKVKAKTNKKLEL